MAEPSSNVSQDFTIRKPLFQVGALFFGVGAAGGLVTDGFPAWSFPVFLDWYNLTLLGIVLLGRHLGRWSLSHATAALIYGGASSFLATIVYDVIRGAPNLDASVYNNLLIVALFQAVATFGLGKSAPLILGGAMLATQLTAALVWPTEMVAAHLWFEVPCVAGSTFLLFRYRRSLQRLLTDLETSLLENKLLRDRERLAALGELSARISHEIKNPLNLVVNFAESSQLLIEDLEAELARPSPTEAEKNERAYLLNELKQNLLVVRNQGLRGVAITRSMLMLARSSSPGHHPADLNTIVQESFEWAWLGQPEPRLDVERVFSPAPGPLVIAGDRSELTRAFTNLCSNAFWSVGARFQQQASFAPRVSVTITCSDAEATIAITDNGLGFDEEQKQSFFTPFFTTKPTGEGTGLGLALAREIIVGQHGGRIEAEGKPLVGATFTVVLALHRGERS